MRSKAACGKKGNTKQQQTHTGLRARMRATVWTAVFARSMRAMVIVCCACALSLCLGGCTGGSSQGASSPPQPTENETPTTSGMPATGFTPVFHTAEFDASAAQTSGDCAIDVSHAAQGYIAATATSDARLKLQVNSGDQSYNYDLPGDGSPLVVPVNMGSGTYLVRIMQNTTADRYVELFATSVEVALESEWEPFVRPNVFCNYTQDSACVALAAELCADAENESAAFDAIYDYICTHISYDYEKADKLATVTGYVPNPDETLAAGSGICFDYASLVAAMLRSQGIPTKILTGYVSPDNVYHAWDMIYINGQWASLHIDAQPGQWARADVTFAANGAADTIGDASAYAERYTY